MVLDREIVASFGKVFDQARSWQERPDHSLSELPRIIKGLPALGEVVVEGRSILALMGGEYGPEGRGADPYGAARDPESKRSRQGADPRRCRRRT